MKSFLSAAIEAHREPEVEKEYSYFVRLTQEQLTAVRDLPGAVVGSTFSETKLPSSPGLASRLRCYIKDGECNYELTTKTYSGEAKTKGETNDVLSQVNYESLDALGVSKNIRTRILLPVYKDGEPVQRKDGPLAWEFDLYHLNNAERVSSWAKVELEVDTVAFPDIIDMIPFDYEELISADTTDPDERNFIAHLYANVYNVVNVHGNHEENPLLFS